MEANTSLSDPSAVPVTQTPSSPTVVSPATAVVVSQTPHASVPASATTTSPTQPASSFPSLVLAPVVDGLVRPTSLTHAFDDRLFVTEQHGRIRIIQEGELLEQPFLDVQQRVGATANEQGLLSLAFHPDYISNGQFFVNYTNLEGQTIVSRFTVSNDPSRADAESETILLAIDQPNRNHNGGQIQFGPDGYLYIGMGDGGGAGDPTDQGQNPGTLLGALLRIDVNSSDSGLNYGVPPDNPFSDFADWRPEVWAIGLRNPWRFSFDRLTGDLFIADVGQNRVEEVHFTPFGEGRALNYGWRVMEGSECFRQEACDRSGLDIPIAGYDHSLGCSIAGGYVYRGRRFPESAGVYYFGDYCEGTIWSLRSQEGEWEQTVELDSDLIVSSFGEDARGELYVLDHAGGALYQLQW